jgi:hypothetical protein
MNDDELDQLAVNTVTGPSDAILRGPPNRFRSGPLWRRTPPRAPPEFSPQHRSIIAIDPWIVKTCLDVPIAIRISSMGGGPPIGSLTNPIMAHPMPSGRPPQQSPDTMRKMVDAAAAWLNTISRQHH